MTLGGLALDHHTLQPRMSVAGEKYTHVKHALVLCPNTMSCSRWHERYEMGERC